MTGAPVDAQAVAFLAQLASAGAVPVHTLTPAIARANSEAAAPIVGGPGEPVAEQHELSIPTPEGEVPARLYVPVSPSGPLLVALHGGGFVVGTLDGYRPLHTTLAARTGARVLAVGYRLAPEHRFPAAVVDTLAATRWALEHAAELGADRVGVFGDSAGGTLAAVAARHLGADLDAQILVYPATDATAVASSYTENAEGYYLSGADMRWYWSQYLGDSHGDSRVDPTDPDVSPLHAVLAPGPRALVVTAGLDPLRDEGEAYADALAAAGTEVLRLPYPDQIHGFVRMLAVMDAGAEVIDRIAAFLAG